MAGCDHKGKDSVSLPWTHLANVLYQSRGKGFLDALGDCRVWGEEKQEVAS